MTKLLVAGWFYLIFFVFFSFQIDPSKNFSVVARVAYDAIEERLNIVEEVDVEEKRMFYEYIFLHREVIYCPCPRP